MQAAGGSFLALGFLGRLPAAMNQLGMLLIVSASGRGLALAGSTVAAVGLGTAAGAPLVGRLVDRIGAVRVLACALVVQSLALAGVLACLYADLSSALILIFAALLGCANPQAGSIARACWSAIARADAVPARALRTIRLGLGFETAADETSFVVGPVAAGALVTLLGAEGAALSLLVLTVLGEGAFALWLACRPALSRPHHDGGAGSTQAQARTPWVALAPVLLTIGAVGVVFGATQTALTAVHTAHGTPGLTGPIYGSMGITSALAGMVAPSLRTGVLARTALGGLLVLICSSVLTAVPGTPLTLAMILIMGAGVGTVLATSYTRIEAVAVSGRVTSLMTVAATCNVLGVSLGSVATGALGANLHYANLPAVAAGAVILALAAAQALTGRTGSFASE
ncbi:MFS transporter [Actinomyces urogenitalis]|uniref:MFS transporter n=1 Tax=Actinomyces urogenitalis TaxID=103621 RepID=UPI00189873D0|nr:MFS transporter [Actinomyces urogenitalis]WOO94884.1 MFS transporter [Actinomyces urogenitalis]